MKNADALAIEVYDHVLATCESLEEDFVGADLAYLMGAILKGGYCGWSKSRAIVAILEEKYPSLHPIWRFVEIEEEEGRLEGSP